MFGPADPQISLGIFNSNLAVSGSRTGAFITALPILIAWIAIPLARPFLAGTVGIGLLIGIVL